MKMKRILTLTWQHALIGLLCVSLVACTVDEVLSSIDVALQTAASLSTAIGAVSPADGAAITLLTGLGIKGLQAIQAAYDQYEKNKTSSTLQNVVDAATAIQTNLPQELAALKISSPEAVTKATAWVNLMVACAQGVVTVVTAAAGSRRATAASYTLTGEYIQSQWQSTVCGGDAACGALVKVHHKHAHWKL